MKTESPDFVAKSLQPLRYLRRLGEIGADFPPNPRQTAWQDEPFS
jgi:hypothetical protein